MSLGRIHKLDDLTASKIAAGEVVEKPATVVKELVENAIDAGSKRIHVLIEKGGKKKMQVIDNGTGIDRDDLNLVFERHATSKINKLEDLYETATLGFRGEALASISAVSEVELITRTQSDQVGIKALAKGGKLLEVNEIGALVGTSVSVVNLFYNTPARLKFLKSDKVETRHISELMSHLALSHPEIAFEYTQDGKTIFQTPGDGQLKNTIYEIYDRELTQNIFEIEHQALGIKLTGYASAFAYTKGNTTMQTVFINGRFVKSDLIKEAIMLAYKPYLMGNRYPVCFLFFDLAPKDIDVNIHPAKTEIKFHHEGDIKQVVYTALRKAFNLQNQMPSVKFTEKEIFNVSKWQTKDDVQGGDRPEQVLNEAVERPQVVSTEIPKREIPKREIPKREIPNVEEPQNESVQGIVPPKVSAEGQVASKPLPSEAKTTDIDDSFTKAEVVLPSEVKTRGELQRDLNAFDRDTKKGVSSGVSYENKPKDHAQRIRETSLNPTKAQGQIDFANYDLSGLSDFADQVATFNRPLETETIYDGLNYIGSFINTYLIFEKEASMYLIDQHAAHEKILYEQFMTAYADGKVDTQLMMLPETISYSITRSHEIDLIIKSLGKAGFDLETFGPKTLLVRGIPSFMTYTVAERLIKEVLEGISGAIEDQISEKLMSKACKAAIKAYDTLMPMEVSALLNALKTLESPYTCPHGRPIIIEMTKGELERKFKRVL